MNQQSIEQTNAILCSNLADLHKAFQRVVGEDGRADLAHLSVGLLEMQQGQCGMAVDAFAQAIADNPDHFRGYFYRGTAYLRLEDYPAAILDLNKALELNPELGMAYLERALCYQELGQVDLAEKDLQTSLMYSAATIQGFADSMGILRAHCFDVEALLEGNIRTEYLTEEETRQVVTALN